MEGRTEARRTVVHGDALAWLADNPRRPGISVIASLPDVSELGTGMADWEATFRRAATLSLEATPDDGVAIFFQTDLKREGRWISKAAMVLGAGAAAGVPLLWHKLVCRKSPGEISRGRPGFSHLLAFSRGVRDDANRPSPDVLDSLGHMPWSHSMGTRAAEASVAFVRRFSPATHTIVAPFCGVGTVLAVANAAGLAAIGIEWNRRRAETAQGFELPRPEETVA